MSLRRCIPELLSSGAFTRDQADRVQGLYDELERDYSSKFGKQAAEAMASEEAVKRFAAEAALSKRQAALQVKAQQAIASDVRMFKGDSPGASAVALFTHDSRAPYRNVERMADSIEGQAHAMMAGLLERFHRNAAGQVRDTATLRNVVREAFGEATGDVSARELASAWMDTAEMLRLRFNAAGGGIGKLEHWGLPQVHDMMAVRSSSFEEWRDFIAPLLDRNKMKDVSGNPLTAGQLELALRDVYESIATDGWNKRKAGQAGGSKLGNRHRDSRFLVFKDADAWMAYSNKFGRPPSKLAEAIDPDGPIFDAMIGHIKGMSSDIALMERLGPNPAATVRWITDGLQIEATKPGNDVKRIDGARVTAKQVETLYQELSGANASMEKPRVGRFFGAVRSWQSAAKLGSAVLSAVTDVGFQHVTARFNGLPASRVLSGYARMLNPASHTDRQLAMRLWLTAGEMAKMAQSQNRFTNEVVTGELAGRLAEGVMRISGLSAWTQAGRWGFGREFWSFITDQSSKNFDNIAPPFRAQLQRYGFDAAAWDRIRSTPHEDVGGTNWLLPENIEDRQLAERLAEMVATETDYAVPTASIRVTSAINSTLKRGTWIGEIGRSLLLFKAFPLTVMWMHGRRFVEQQGFDKMKYAANLMIATTLLGGLAMQLKSIAGGKDPQDMTDPAFWGKAVAQGGGLGIMGDFLNNATSRFDQDFWTTFLGPVAGSVDDIRKVAKPGNTARDLRRLIQSNLPGSSLWYAKLAFNREVLDQMQAQSDPEYYSSFDRMERRAREDGTAYWWRPGQTGPDRPPELDNAVAQ